METDEKTNPEGQQESETSSEEETTDNVREDEQTQSEEEAPVPRWRVKELTDEKNQLKENLETLRGDIETLKQGQTPAEEDEPIDWKEAEKRTVDKAVNQMRGELKTKAEQDNAQDRAIEKNFEQLKSMGQDITPEIKKIVLTEMIKSGNEDVFDTYLKIKEQSAKTVKTEEIKKEGFVPSSQKGGGAGTGGFDYNSIKGKNPMDIAREAGE